MLLCCSGTSGSGQLADQAVAELTKEGFGEIFSLSGAGANMLGVVQAARDTACMVVVDGCDKACGKTLLEQLAIKVTHHVVVSRLAINTDKGMKPAAEDVSAVKHSVKLASGKPIRVTFHSPKPLSPGDRSKSRLMGGKCC